MKIIIAGAGAVGTHLAQLLSRDDQDIVVIDTAEYALPGVDPEFRPITSVWILSSLVTDRLSAYYELNTKHNLAYRRYYHQFDY